MFKQASIHTKSLLFAAGIGTLISTKLKIAKTKNNLHGPLDKMSNEYQVPVHMAFNMEIDKQSLKIIRSQTELQFSPLPMLACCCKSKRQRSSRFWIDASKWAFSTYNSLTKMSDLVNRFIYKRNKTKEVKNLQNKSTMINQTEDVEHFLQLYRTCSLHMSPCCSNLSWVHCNTIWKSATSCLWRSQVSARDR